MHPGLSEFKQLPKVDDDIIAIFSSRGIPTIRKLQELSPQKYDALFGHRYDDEKAEIKRVLQSLPIFDFQVFIRRGSSGDRESVRGGGNISFNRNSDELEVSIRLLRGNPKAKIHAPKYHKTKVATYWLLVGSADSLICCRRVDAAQSESKVKVPANRLPTGGCVVHAEIVSDSMIGFSYSLSFNL